MSNESNDEVINERLDRIRQKPRRTFRWKPYAIGAGLFLAGVGITSYGFLMVQGLPEEDPFSLPTSDVSEFQDDQGLDGFTFTQPRSETADQPQTQPSQEEEQPPAIDQAQLENLTGRIEELQQQLTSRNDQMGELQEEIEAAKAERAEQEQALQQAERENLRLQSQIETQEQLFEQQQNDAQLEAQRRAELDARRAEQEALEEAQITSPMVAYRATGGGGPSGGGGANGGGEGIDEPRSYEGDESFLRAGADKSSVTKSEIIANPAHTIVQGTMIEATLETAINTQLEGNVAANVSYDVWSMDMSQVLIPRGSKLYGRYSSEVRRGQRRVLIAWDRLVTSDGQSVQLEGYGTDRVGRSGMPGDVNNHTLTRFGTAAAVSIVGALPAVLAAAVEKEEQDSVSRDTAENMGQNASEAINGVIADNLNMPPTIAVDHGEVVMVTINKDIELF